MQLLGFSIEMLGGLATGFSLVFSAGIICGKIFEKHSQNKRIEELQEKNSKLEQRIKSKAMIPLKF